MAPRAAAHGHSAMRSAIPPLPRLAPCGNRHIGASCSCRGGRPASWRRAARRCIRLHLSGRRSGQGRTRWQLRPGPVYGRRGQPLAHTGRGAGSFVRCCRRGEPVYHTAPCVAKAYRRQVKKLHDPLHFRPRRHPCADIRRGHYRAAGHGHVADHKASLLLQHNRDGRPAAGRQGLHPARHSCARSQECAGDFGRRAGARAGAVRA